MQVHQSFLRLFNVMRSRLIHVLLRLHESKEVHARGNQSIHWNRLVIRRWNALECGKGVQYKHNLDKSDERTSVALKVWTMVHVRVLRLLAVRTRWSGNVATVLRGLVVMLKPRRRSVSTYAHSCVWCPSICSRC